MPDREVIIDPGRVVHETIDGEVIIIQLERGNYYSLSGTGEEIWRMLGDGLSRNQLIARLEGRYSAADGEIPAAVDALLQQLLEEQLVQKGDGSARAVAPPVSGNGSSPAAEGEAFQAAKLEKYTDMQDYLLIDPIHDVSGTGWPSVKPSE
jgi:hypothetical protein